MASPFPPKTLRALAVLAALVAIPYATPRLARLRVLTPRATSEAEPAPAAPSPSAIAFGEARLDTETKDRPELAAPDPASLPRDVAPLVEEKKPPRSIEDPTGHAMDAFYARLAATDRKEPHAVTRITHFGDSLLVTDWVTGTIRRRMQERFGDAGHGFLLLAAGWPGYFHNDVAHTASSGWTVSRIVGPRSADGLYGLGGVSFVAKEPGPWAKIATAKKGTLGRSASRLVVDYLAQPGGGELEVKVDGAAQEPLRTDATDVSDATKAYDVPDGPHAFELRVTKGPVRGFGVWLERDVPGVVYDALGILGARARQLDELDDGHFARQLALRDPALVVLQFGINESADGWLFPAEQVEATLRPVLKQIREALPRGSCLVISALDRADKTDTGYVSRSFAPKLVGAQRAAAVAEGCAFWDAYQAMGGEGSMGRWATRGLGGQDLAHPSSAGAEVLGTWIYRALVDGYAAFRAREGSAAR